MQLEKATCRAPAALVVDVGTATAIARPHQPPDRRRHVARALTRLAGRRVARCGGSARAGRGPRLSRPACLGCLPRERLLEEGGERPLDDHRRGAVRQLVTQEILKLAERPVRLLAHGHSQKVAPRRQRLDPRRATHRRHSRRPRGDLPVDITTLGPGRHRRRCNRAVAGDGGVERVTGTVTQLPTRRRAARQRRHPRRHIGPRRDLGNWLLDLALGLPRSPRQQRRVVLLGQVTRQQVHARQMDRPRRDHPIQPPRELHHSHIARGVFGPARCARGYSWRL